MNYTVSGGNYFRKNADGSPGDDVGAIYGDTGSIPTQVEEAEMMA